MAIANITNNILTDSGVATSSLLTTSAAASTYLALAGGTMTGAIVGTTSTFTNAGSGIGVGITLSGASGDGLKVTHSAGRALNIASSGAGYGIIINNDTASTSIPFTIQKSGSNVITMSDTGAANFTGQLTLGSTITNGSSTYTLPSATGTLALTSALSSYLPLTGGTLTGPLIGTTATFSGVITSTQGNNGTLLQGTSATTGWVHMIRATNTGQDVTMFIENSTGGDRAIGTLPYAAGLCTYTNTALQFGTNNNIRLTIGGTGAATFSSSVQADGSSSGFLISQNGGAAGLATYSANSDRAQIAFKYAQNYPASNNYTRVLDIVSTGDATGGGAIRFLTSVNNAAPTEKMLITSGGNVLIGTTTDNGSKLQVQGGIRFNYSDNYGYFGLNYVSGADYGFYNYNYGRIDLKISQSTGAATFSSSVTATSFFESSDSRLKTLIQDNYQTKGIASITPKLYTKNGKVELGYYAQDFVGVLDSAVSKGEDDMLSLSYREVLVAKVYALEQEIKELKAKIN